MSNNEKYPQARKGKQDAKQSRKRAQNRISQQCRRERDSARARHLEHALTAIQSTSNLDCEDRYSALVQSHLRLLDDNENLQEALFNFRKRLLSMSNAAAAAAEEPVFDLLLNKHKIKGDRSSVSSKQLDGPDSFNASVGATTSQPEATTADANSWNISCNIPSPFSYNPGLGLPLNDFARATTLNLGSNLSTLENSVAFSHEAPTLFDILPQIGTHHTHVRSPTEFANKVLSACRQYLEDEMSATPAGLTLSLREIQNEVLYQQVSAAAIRLLSCAAGIESYVYHIGRADYLEKIVRWRLSALPDDGATIPQPFAPTRLQHRQNGRVLKHHLLIDFICWPEIRDQCIVNASRLDLDELQRDIVLNTVIEIPRYGVALNVFDFVNNWIDTHHHSSTYVRNADWTFFKANEKADSSGINRDPIEGAILQELRCIIHKHTAAISELATATDSSMNTAYEASKSTLTAASWRQGCTRSDAMAAGRGPEADAVNFLSAQDTSTWKLSKSFARKYHMIECSSALSRYETAMDLDFVDMVLEIGDVHNKSIV